MTDTVAQPDTDLEDPEDIPPVEQPAPAKPPLSTFSILLISLISGFLGGLVVLGLNTFDARPTPTFAVVNIEDILEDHIVEIAKRKLTPEQKQEVSTTFSEKFNALLQTLIAQEHLILFARGAVINDLPDYTGHIQTKLSITKDDY